MWVFTKYGFFSVTVNSFAKKRNEEMQIRARVKKHLLDLKSSFGLHHKISETPNNDYRWRIQVSRDLWTRIAEGLAEEIDYSNFKRECHGKYPLYDQALMRIWGIMHSMQEQVHPRSWKPGQKKLWGNL